MSGDNALQAQTQEQLLRFQQLQQTLQAIISQRQQLELENAEIDRALSELEKVSSDEIIYKSIGSLLMKSDKEKLVEELRERKELTATRLTVLKRQQSRAEEKAKELQQAIQAKLKPSA